MLSEHLPGREVRVFGSRATGRAKPHSDLDLIVMGDEPVAALTHAELVSDFDESDLPFRVDLVLWRNAPPALRAVIAREAERLTN